MPQSTQKLLDQFLPKLQSIARKLATNRQVQEDLVQEMSLHLCQLIMEGNAPPDDGVTGEGKSVPHKRCSACRGGLAAITKDIAMCLKCGSVFEELVNRVRQVIPPKRSTLASPPNRACYVSKHTALQW